MRTLRNSPDAHSQKRDGKVPSSFFFSLDKKWRLRNEITFLLLLLDKRRRSVVSNNGYVKEVH